MADSKKRWLITGADKGLGAATARAALERGNQVVVTVLAADGKHPLSKEYPDRFRSLHLDSRDIDRIGPVVAEAEASFGGIDVLLNNAGYGVASVAELTPPDLYRPMFEVNLFSLVEMTHAVLPGMRRQGSGHILNIASLAGFSAYAGFALYASSKFAVEGYSEGLAKEVASLGIRVTIIEPGAFRTDFRGGSLARSIGEVSDYAPLEASLEAIAKSSGLQPNDPAKFGKALCELVDAPNPPIRLPLGVDALKLVRDEIAAVGVEVDKWEDLARSTGFDA